MDSCTSKTIKDLINILKNNNNNNNKLKLESNNCHKDIRETSNYLNERLYEYKWYLLLKQHTQ